MLYKIIEGGSFDFGVPYAELIQVHSRGVDRDWMRKRAAALTRAIADIRPAPGFSHIHLISLGADEYVGKNRNGDGFNELPGIMKAALPNKNGPFELKIDGGLVEYHPTFGKDAWVFEDHVNHDPKKAIGEIFAHEYNRPMHRGELIIKVAEDHLSWREPLQKLARGEPVAFSMSCVTDPTYPVRVPLGYKAIADLRPGDRVLTHTGKWQKVKSLNRRMFTGELVEMHVNGLPLPLEVTDDHPMWAKVFAGSRHKATVKAKAARYFTDPEAFAGVPSGWTHAGHLDKGDRLFYQPIEKIPGYGRLESVELAAFLGYYVAEGSVQYCKENPNTVGFCCNVRDSLPRVLPKLLGELYPDVTVGIKPHKLSKTGLIVTVYSADLANFILEYCGKMFDGKYICPELYNAEREVKAAFLGAWLDGDGFVDKKGVHWSSGSRDLILQGRDLLVSMGVPASIYKIVHHNGYKDGSVEYTLNVSHLDAEFLAAWSDKAKEVLGYVGELKRTKPATMRPCPDGRYAYRLKKVVRRQVENVQTYNVEVEEDESYTLAGLISHNCKVPFDVCTGCLKQARHRGEYCEHLRDHMGVMLKSGQVIGAMNTRPKFFDISKVVRPADRTAWSLRKVARSLGSSTPGGAELAEAYGMFGTSVMTQPSRIRWAKKTAAAKLAAIEKQITMQADEPAVRAEAAGCCAGPMAREDIELMRKAKLGSVLQELADAKICLSVSDFVRLIGGDEAGCCAEDVAQAVPQARSGLCDDDLDNDDWDPSPGPLPDVVRNLIRGMMPSRSLDRDRHRGRISVMLIRRGAPTIKQASAASDRRVEKIAAEYAKYQTAFLAAAGGSDELGRLTVLQTLVNV